MPPADADTTWVWSPPLGAYYHAASGTYALPGEGGSGGAWTYLSPEELAARGAAGSSNTSAGPSRTTASGTTPAPAADEKEDGEVEDDVGWGGLMEPEKLERVMRDKAAASATGVAVRHDRTPAAAPGSRYGDEDRHTAYGGKRDDRKPPNGSEREGYRDRDRDRDEDRYGERIRHPGGGDRSSGTGNDPAARFREWTHSGASTPILQPPLRGDDSVEDDDAPAPDASAHLLRLVIKRSKHLPLGGVAVLDGRAGGIQLGRDRCERGAPARLRVREMEVSKTHALVYHGKGGDSSSSPSSPDEEEADGWWIVDLGSTLGTYVAHRGERDATRLSSPKCSSRPHALRHLSRVTVGTTTAVAHVHDDWPCGECQLSGNVQIALDDGTLAAEEAAAAKAAAAASAAPPDGARSAERMGRGDRQFKRKLEMTALRDTLLGGADGGAPGRGVPNKAAYVDRSAQRRRLHPASPPPRHARPAAPATEAPVVSGPQGPSTASRAMLARQGWSEGQGLGRDGTGRAAPLEVVVRAERAGLGARGQVADVPGGAVEGDWKSRGRQRRWDEVGGGR